MILKVSDAPSLVVNFRGFLVDVKTTITSLTELWRHDLLFVFFFFFPFNFFIFVISMLVVRKSKCKRDVNNINSPSFS